MIFFFTSKLGGEHLFGHRHLLEGTYGNINQHLYIYGGHWPKTPSALGHLCSLARAFAASIYTNKYSDL